MKRAMLAGAVIAIGFGLTAWADGTAPANDITARGFKPQFDTFAAAHFQDPHFAGPPPLRSRDCEDPEPDRAYTCFYTYATAVDIAAETDRGSDRLARVTLTWDGTDRRGDLFAEAAGFAVGALSRDTADTIWREVARTIYADVPRPPFTFAPQDWHASGWSYRVQHDGRFGARNVVIFTATRDGTL